MKHLIMEMSNKIDPTFKCNKRGILREGESCRFNNNCDYPNCKLETWVNVIESWGKTNYGVDEKQLEFWEWLRTYYNPPIKK
jgi:hypothetical protein